MKEHTQSVEGCQGLQLQGNNHPLGHPASLGPPLPWAPPFPTLNQDLQPHQPQPDTFCLEQLVRHSLLALLLGELYR